MDCCLKISSLAVGRDHPLIAGIDFTLPQGQTLAVIGESGCGKSTLLSTLAGIQKPLAGGVCWISDGKRVTPKCAMVWQDLALLPWKRVRDNLALPLLLAHEQDIASRVQDMLEEMELTSVAESYPQCLSGGQRQRLALGRALIVRPDVLFMDEPFSALDAILREKLQDFLLSQWHKYHCSIILVTHDMAEAAFLGQHIMLLDARSSSVAAVARNSAFSNEGVDIRKSDHFYRVQRHLYAALSEVRAGKMVRLPGDAQW